MTATDEAYQALAAFIPLNPTGESVVVCLFEGLPKKEFRKLTGRSGAPETEHVRRVVGKLGHLGQASAHAACGRVVWHVTTKDPAGVLGAILGAVSVDMQRHLTVAKRPVAMSVFEVLYPEGKSTFAFPL